MPKFDMIKTAAVGAMAAVVVVGLTQAFGDDSPAKHGLPYWGGVGVGGALIGFVLAVVVNWRRS
jgi:hypothetical protein